jgi:hypothetical protein
METFFFHVDGMFPRPMMTLAQHIEWHRGRSGRPQAEPGSIGISADASPHCEADRPRLKAGATPEFVPALSPRSFCGSLLRRGDMPYRRERAVPEKATGRAMCPACRQSCYLPLMRDFSSFSKLSTLALSITWPGTMIRPFAGMPFLSPSRYAAISFMP